jgi:hypothetical protein
MIMRGSTPRALTWSGLLAVAGFGIVLLPVLPTWAQTPSEDKISYRLAVDNLIEQQKAQAEAQKAQAESAAQKAALAKAKMEFEQAQAQLKEAQANLKQAAERLALVSGKAKLGPSQMTITIRTPDGKTETITVPTDVKIIPEQARVILNKLGERGANEFRVKVLDESPAPKKPGAAPEPPKKTPPEARNQDLEKRLDRLMQEIESLRKELRLRKPVEPHSLQFTPGEGHLFEFKSPVRVEYQLRKGSGDTFPEKQ